MRSIIFLDAGHSGTVEPGAVAHPWTEARLALSITLAAGAALQSFGQRVIFSRKGEADNDLLGWRVELANDCGAVAFVSVHCNSFGTPAAYGVETFHAPGSREGSRLAAAIQTRLVGLDYSANRGVKEASYYVLTATAAPAALVECGFMSNPADLAVLTNPRAQLAIGGAIAAGIMDWLAGF